MMRARRLMFLLTLAALIAGTVATVPAEAAKRKVPFGFFGTVVPPELSSSRVPNLVLVQQMQLMARSGVESIRITAPWDEVEPRRGVYSFGNLDRLVRTAAVFKLRVLFNVTSTPKWASSKPDAEFWRAPPTDPSDFGAMMAALTRRYGPSGTFWPENPTVPANPVRRWQIWNEENAPWHWSQRRWAPGYGKILKAAYKSIKAIDRGATVIAGSFVAAPNYSQWGATRDLYKAVGKKWFDELAVHPYTNNKKSVDGTIDQMLEIVKLVRKETRRAHDGRVPISITELSWPASVGKVPKKALLGLETNTKGQNLRLKAGYKRLVKMRRKLGLREAQWYTWATQYDRKGALSVMSFRYAGLTRVQDGAFSPMPLLRTFTNLAAKYEGCRKTTDARTCG